ncbi:MAG: hypothetical protein L0099_09655 [Acidobacteria bacterium]|nr:hypothetical protein [Acidobacteriota bacterium]
MAKKKTKRLAVKIIKGMARERVGIPPPTRREPDVKKQRKEKHKATLGRLLSEE